MHMTNSVELCTRMTLRVPDTKSPGHLRNVRIHRPDVMRTLTLCSRANFYPMRTSTHALTLCSACKSLPHADLDAYVDSVFRVAC